MKATLVEDLSWRKLAFLLKGGAVVVMPTDTIYGICGSALIKKTVEKIYELRKRTPQKPMIILISSLRDLKTFKINIAKKDKEILKKIWPARISVILECQGKKFEYLHRGTKTLALRLPPNNFLKNVLKISGPLVAPSANWEGETPAETALEAKKYFGKRVVYYNGGKMINQASTLIKLKNGKLEMIRKGEDWQKLKMLKLKKQ
ncbi:threonylcarbamoyl-AMP synthase [Candidatus Shapirobacteria bacterium]|nr:threonylcarbamoyl-AMP synthase [Candidatus Shapirobacteria bacterium]